MDLGDLELRGILARKSKLFLWLDCSRAWPHLRRSQINAGEKRKYRAPNIGSSDLGSCFYWNCRSRDDFRTRIRARAGLASDYRYLGDRLRSHYAYASRLLVGGRKKFAARGIIPDFVFPYCCSLAATFRAANNGGGVVSRCPRHHPVFCLGLVYCAKPPPRKHTPPRGFRGQ